MEPNEQLPNQPPLVTNEDYTQQPQATVPALGEQPATLPHKGKFKKLLSNKKLWIAVIVVVVAVAIALAAYFLFIKNEETQPKIYRVGVISGNASFANGVDGFRARMTELGYNEGQNITYDIHQLSDDRAGEKQVSEQLVADNVDLIFAYPTEPAFAAKEAAKLTNIPIVFAHAGVEENDLINNVREPGGNITGVRFLGPDLSLKRFEYLLDIKPSIKQLYIPYQEGYPNDEPALKALRPIAEAEGVTLIEFPATTTAEIASVLQNRSKTTDIGIDAILFLPDQLNGAAETLTLLSQFADTHSIPFVGSSDKTLLSGSLFTYNSNIIDEGRLAAELADKIFKGTPAGTIPVVSPNAYLKINYPVVQKLGLTVPEAILSMAAEIIR